VTPPTLWRLHPDWRFGQMVENLARKVNRIGDPYEFEDDKWLVAIDQLIQEAQEDR
jgi:hypothetical protein